MDKNSEIFQLLKTQIEVLPQSPGIYQFFDSTGVIIYVGKAKNLKKRVSSYFSKEHEDAKTRILVRKIHNIEYVVVDTEMDALLLENNLIKKYQPRYNILLKDDKTFPYIIIKNEPFPRVFQTRNVEEDKSKYFGPYTNIKLVYTILDLFKQLYKLRNCKHNLSESNIQQKKIKVCLEYHIGNCLAPCIGKQSESDYNVGIDHIKKILKGNVSSVIQHLTDTMTQYAKEYKYEEAQMVKEKIELLKGYQSKSTIVNPAINDVDVFSLVADEKFGFVNYFKVVNGSIIQTSTVEIVKKLNETNEELLSFAIVEIRNRFKSKSKEILVPFEIDLTIPMTKTIVPQIGDKKKLLELSERNAKFYRLDKLKQYEKINPNRYAERVLAKIKTDLNLPELPTRIECFDNSNIQGNFAVAACVVFVDAKPKKSEYRHFNIKTVEGPDDFASMEEVVYRRYKRMIDEEKELPQLIVIDGGKGQLNAALKSLTKLEIENKVAIIGIAKKLEEIFKPNDPLPLYLDKNSESLKVIQQLRDEAHRFGITHHRNKRSKETIKSEIHSINGIGDKTAEKLLSTFKSVKKIQQATHNELIEAVGEAKTRILENYFATKISNP